MVVFEGTLAPELTVRGDAFFEADRDSMFCKRNLLQRPTFLGITVPGKLRRIAGGKHQFRFDLREAKQGGFCRYTLRIVDVEAMRNDNKFWTTSVASLVPEYSIRAGWEREVRDPENTMKTTCRRGPPSDPRRIDCVLLERTAPTLYGDTKLVLNVVWDDQPTPEATAAPEEYRR